jgi:signal transduction histidine kinase/DNA-binding response OmpR family regulator
MPYSEHPELQELHLFLKTIEDGGDWATLEEGDSPLVARVRALLAKERSASLRITQVEAGLETIASSLMQLATGQFALELDPAGHDDMVDAAYVGLTMLAEELEHSRSAMEAARDAALEANRSKSAFLANMSHELRTPLNAIIGYCELLADDLQDLPGAEPLTADLDRVLSSAHHLLGLISDVLDLSKIEAGRLEFDIKAFDPAPLIEEVVRALQPKAEQRGNLLVLDAPEGIRMLADGFRLKQILFNLLGNAIKFTERGTITVTLAVDEDGAHLTVADDGPGIAPDRHDAVFSPFVQEDQHTAATYGGTGLGLAITQRLCRLMHGDIALESDVGEGARFTVTLPVEDVPTEKSAPNREVPVVLVVDDDPIFRGLVARYLAGLRCHLEFARNGREALSFAAHHVPDLVLLDIMMPTLDGWTTLTYLKAQPALAGVPVVMVSVVDAGREPAVLGASDFLVKPIERTALLATVERHLYAERRDVLVVDDDPNALEIASRQLRKSGYRVQLANDGVEAMATLRTSRPDLVLLDLNMPRKNGFQVIEEMAADDALAHVPIVVLTAQMLTDAERRMLLGHVDHVVTKGSGGPVVLSAVRAALAPRHQV